MRPRKKKKAADDKKAAENDALSGNSGDVELPDHPRLAAAVDDGGATVDDMDIDLRAEIENVLGLKSDVETVVQKEDEEANTAVEPVLEKVEESDVEWRARVTEHFAAKVSISELQLQECRAERYESAL